MDFCLATVAALVSLFAAARCAPAAQTLQDACADVRSSSLEFNHVAQTVRVEARNGSTDLSKVSTSLLWMEAKDMCDPETLGKNPATCLGKMLNVLSSYQSAVGTVAGYESCSEFVSRVKPVMQKLHKNMSKCVKSRTGINHQMESNGIEEATQQVLDWQKPLLCQYILDRLFSFSILTARVFAVGDPANHKEGSAQKCM